MAACATVGARSEASGVHMWKGTSDTLKASPTRSRPVPTRKSGLSSIEEEIFQGPLDRGHPPAVEPDEDVDRDRQRLQPEEDRHQVGPLGPEHPPPGGEL